MTCQLLLGKVKDIFRNIVSVIILFFSFQKLEVLVLLQLFVNKMVFGLYVCLSVSLKKQIDRQIDKNNQMLNLSLSLSLSLEREREI